jgi:enoyl-CoA hydratase
MTSSLVLYEVKEQIAYITLNRPDKLNAITRDMRELLSDTWKRFEKDTDARVAIIHGNGEAFCAGADLTYGSPMTPAPGKVWPGPIQNEAKNGVDVLKPVIGAVHGYAVGFGFGIAMHNCDLLIAAESALFGFPEPKIGDVGGIHGFRGGIPTKIALEISLSGQMMDARRAYEVGIVNRVVPDAELMNETVSMANIIKKNAPLTLRIIKYGHYRDSSDETSRLQREVLEFNALMLPQNESEDRKEGARAFKEEREPKFTGK